MHNGKDIQPFSWFGSAEGELLLSPNMEFVVTKPEVRGNPYRNYTRALHGKVKNLFYSQRICKWVFL